jgi:Fur family transcriptional regulator, ferric uptake regulator
MQPASNTEWSDPADYVQRGIDRLRAHLRARRMKLPRVRELIARCALKQTVQFSAVELLHALQAESSPQCSAAHAVTIYRALPLLVDAGLLRTHWVARGETQHYEVAFEREAMRSLTCIACGRRRDFESSVLTALHEEIAQRFDFELAGNAGPLHGHCDACWQARAALER